MRIQRLAIQNFKAFKEKEVFEVEGKNLLICGNNGSGKSSLHYALHVFFQSSLPDKAYNKYFVPADEPGGEESLLNIYADPTQFPYLIELEVKKGTDIQKYQLTENIAEGALSNLHQDIELSDFASDFISHRQLFRFYYFRNSQDANIWSLFEKEIFPYWRDDESGKTFDIWLKELKSKFDELSKQTEVLTDESGDKQKTQKKYNRNSTEYINFQAEVTNFNKAFIAFYDSIKDGINTILNEFLPDEKLDVQLDYKTPLDTDPIYEWLWNEPELIIKLKSNGLKIPKPHIYLNEGRLTALALAIRLAMFERKFKGTGDDVIKLLVLDDLLISLDMSFRMRLIDYIQKQMKQDGSFYGYQLFIFTHDKGLFEILKESLARDEKKWKWYEMFENNTYPITEPEEYKNPLIIEKEDYLSLGIKYLFGFQSAKQKIDKNYEIAALCLRKKTEQLIKRYYDPGMEQIFRYRILENLSTSISNLNKEYLNHIFSKLDYILSQNKIDETQIDKLINLDLDKTGMTPEELAQTGILLGFKKKVFELIKYHYKNQTNYINQKRELENLSKELNLLRSRIMNIGAHHDDSPLYELELRGAVDKIKEFEIQILKLNRI